MTAMKVGDGIFSVTVPTPFAVGPVNIYIVVKENRMMLVDAGANTDEAWEVLLRALRDLNKRPEDVDVIVLTHHHPDHTGLVDRFPEAIPVCGHPRLEPWLTKDRAFKERYDRYFRDLAVRLGIPSAFLDRMPKLDHYLRYGGRRALTHKLDDGDAVPGFEEWKVCYAPGHAQSHIALLRDDGVLIGGDVLLEHISSNAIVEPPYNDSEPAPHTLLQYRSTLKKCGDWPIRTVLPGHGQAFAFDGRLIAQKLSEQEERRNRIYELIKSGKRTALDISIALFPDAWKKQLDLVLSEVIGHLDWLKSDGLITVNEANGVELYGPAE